MKLLIASPYFSLLRDQCCDKQLATCSQLTELTMKLLLDCKKEVNFTDWERETEKQKIIIRLWFYQFSLVVDKESVNPKQNGYWKLEMNQA